VGKNHCSFFFHQLPQQHILGFAIGLYNYILIINDMQLMTNELLNPCCFIHLVARDI
jgi:hypothetical protein